MNASDSMALPTTLLCSLLRCWRRRYCSYASEIKNTSKCWFSLRRAEITPKDYAIYSLKFQEFFFKGGRYYRMFPIIYMCGHFKNKSQVGLPWWSVVKNLPANAWDMGPILAQEDPTCQEATLLMCSNYWNSRALEPMLHNKRSHCNEKPMHDK